MDTVTDLLEKYGTKLKLLSQGAPRDAETKYSAESAVCVAAQEGQTEVLQVLLEHGADANFVGNPTGDADANVHAALHYAAKVGRAGWHGAAFCLYALVRRWTFLAVRYSVSQDLRVCVTTDWKRRRHQAADRQ